MPHPVNKNVRALVFNPARSPLDPFGLDGGGGSSQVFLVKSDFPNVAGQPVVISADGEIANSMSDGQLFVLNQGIQGYAATPGEALKDCYVAINNNTLIMETIDAYQVTFYTPTLGKIETVFKEGLVIATQQDNDETVLGGRPYFLFGVTRDNPAVNGNNIWYSDDTILHISHDEDGIRLRSRNSSGNLPEAYFNDNITDLTWGTDGDYALLNAAIYVGGQDPFAGAGWLECFCMVKRAGAQSSWILSGHGTHPDLLGGESGVDESYIAFSTDDNPHDANLPVIQAYNNTAKAPVRVFAHALTAVESPISSTPITGAFSQANSATGDGTGATGGSIFPDVDPSVAGLVWRFLMQADGATPFGNFFLWLRKDTTANLAVMFAWNLSTGNYTLTEEDLGGESSVTIASGNIFTTSMQGVFDEFYIYDDKEGISITISGNTVPRVPTTYALANPSTPIITVPSGTGTYIKELIIHECILSEEYIL